MRVPKDVSTSFGSRDDVSSTTTKPPRAGRRPQAGELLFAAWHCCATRGIFWPQLFGSALPARAVRRVVVVRACSCLTVRLHSLQPHPYITTSLLLLTTSIISLSDSPGLPSVAFWLAV
eukprot:COSAG06_NODE_972_length_11272_cov_25.599123_3_plen_119_part_00